MKRKRKGYGIVVVGFMCALAAGAAADTRTWNGNTSSEWYEQTNWSPTGLPAAADHLTVSGAAQTATYVKTDGGGSITIDGPTASVTFTYVSFDVGYSGAGALEVLAGGRLTTQQGYIGNQLGSTGTVTVGNGTWANSVSLYVGRYGDGSLTVRNGAEVSNNIGYVGYGPDSTGTATVDGATWTNNGNLRVGELGRGVLSILNGGDVSNASGYIGGVPGSAGTVTVDGSTWRHSQDLYVGSWGTGAMIVRDGAVVSNTHAYVAAFGSSVGTVTVSGAGAKWTNSGWLYVGGSSALAGGGGRVAVEAGGTVEVGDTLKVWNSGALAITGGTVVTTNFDNSDAGTSTFTGGTLTVDGGSFDPAPGDFTLDGPGSPTLNLTNGAVGNLGSDSLFVGDADAAVLNITSGAQLLNKCGYIGFQAGSSGTVTVDNATWTNSEDLYVGASGGPGVLTICNGGEVTSSPGIIASLWDATGTVTVNNATWNAGSRLDVGRYGAGALTVRNGATVTNTLGYVGREAGSVGTVTLDNGAWVNGSTLYVGYHGDGAVTIRNGGELTNVASLVAHQPGTAGTVTVDGARWECSSGLHVGYQGAAALTIRNGGVVTNAEATIGNQAAGTGTVIVDSATWGCNGDLYVGNEGSGALTVVNGAQVSNTHGYIGFEVGGRGTVTVDNATWANSGYVLVGWQGDGQLTIRNGGEVSNTIGKIGTGPTCTGTVTVDNGTWTNAGILRVGDFGAGALTIRNGAQVASDGGYIGYLSGSSGTVTVESGNWESSLDLDVGCGGAGALIIRNGGHVTNAQATIGHQAAATGTVTVDNAAWGCDGDLYVGREGTGTLTARNGAQVSNLVGYIGHAVGAVGTVTVDNATWGCNGNLYVGYEGSGALTVLNGAQVSNTTGMVGYEVAGSGTVTVDNATWSNSSLLYIGGRGPGVLTARNGARVSNVAGYIGHDVGVVGTVTVDNATWTSGSVLTVGYRGAGALAILNGGQVSNGTAYMAVAGAAAGTVTVAGAGSTWSISGSLIVVGSPLGRASVEVQTGATVGVEEALRLNTSGVVNVNGGTVQFKTLELLGGTFNFNFGTVIVDNDMTLSDPDLITNVLLGSPPTIPSWKTLGVTGQATLMSPLVLDGGTFSVGSLVNPSLLQFDRGTFNLTEDDLTIGPGGLFGSPLRLDHDHHVNVTNSATVDAGALLAVEGGSFSAGALTNNGQMELGGSTSQVSAALSNYGLITGSGWLRGALINRPGGQIRAEGGKRLQHEGVGYCHNYGEITLLGGTFDTAQTIRNNTDGDILGRGTLIAAGLLNYGDAALSAGVTDVHGDVTNASGGRIIISGRADVTFWDDVHNVGTLFRVSADSSATFFGAYSGGTVTGAGHVYFEDDVTPGTSPAAVGFGGDVTFGPLAKLEIEVGGTLPGSGHDQVNVTGQLDLDGMLAVSLIDGFLPEPDDVFAVLTCGGRDGQFAGVTGLDDLGGLAGLDFELSYEPDAVELAAVAFRGDANLDAKVDILDLARLANHYGQTGATWRDCDFNHDGVVDVLDLAILANNFGIGGGGPATPAGGPVPEPATLLMLALGTLAMLRRRRR